MIEFNDSDIERISSYATSGIDSQDQGQKYPAIQVNKYRGLTPKDELKWVFSIESFSLFPQHCQELLNAEPLECYYSDGDEVTPVMCPTVEMRFVPLFIPKIFKWNKETDTISRLSKFVPGDRTIAKLYLGLLVNGQLLTNEDGLLSPVTLKLKSFKTDEIIGRDSNADGSLKKLALELSKKGIGTKGKSNTHFVNLQIEIASKVYKNSQDQSSRSVYYSLQNAKLNTPETMEILQLSLADLDLQKDILDPFGLDQKTVIGEPINEDNEPLDDICF